MTPAARKKERTSTRHHVALECQLFTELGGRGMKGTTLDVSETGMRFRSDASVTVGEPVVVSLGLPDGSTFVDAEGRVARVEEGLREADDGRAISVEFTAISEDDLSRLVAATAHYPEPVARRGVFRLGERRWR